jgi:hypothetical protein
VWVGVTVWVRVRATRWDICNSGKCRNSCISQWFPICKNSGKCRNHQEFLHFPVIPDVQEFRNSALHLFWLDKCSVGHP